MPRKRGFHFNVWFRNGIQVVRVCKRSPPRTCWNSARAQQYALYVIESLSNIDSKQLRHATATWSTGTKSLTLIISIVICLKSSYPNPASGGASCNVSSFLSSKEAMSSFVRDGMASPCPHAPNWHETTGTCTSIETKCGSGWNRCIGCIGFFIKLVLLSICVKWQRNTQNYVELLYPLPRLLVREASSCCGMVRPHSVHNSTWHRNSPSAGETSGQESIKKA